MVHRLLCFLCYFVHFSRLDEEFRFLLGHIIYNVDVAVVNDDVPGDAAGVFLGAFTGVDALDQDAKELRASSVISAKATPRPLLFAALGVVLLQGFCNSPFDYLEVEARKRGMEFT